MAFSTHQGVPRRRGWQVGLAVCAIVLAGAAALVGLSLRRAARPPAASTMTAADAGQPAPALEPAQARAPSSAMAIAFLPLRETRSNSLLTASAHPPRTNRPVARQGGSGPVASRNRAAPTGRELPVFTLLRASLGQPVPPAIAALAASITKDCQTDAARAKAIHDWIAGHISYDWQEWSSIVAGEQTYTQPQDPASVVSRGTAVCAGYAWLYDAMAASVGLEATFVIGNVRGYRGTADDTLITRYQHAWNSVLIDGQWQLLDATWGARQTGESDVDYLARRDYYFNTPANQMIFDHLPETADWQLLKDPVSAEAFQSLPNLKPAFFQNGLKLGNAFSDSLAASAGQPSAILLAAPAGAQIVATLSLNGQDITRDNVALREDGTRHDVLIAPLPPGEYILRLFARPAGQGFYDCAADYVLKVGP